jgi:hypothetical protein
VNCRRKMKVATLVVSGLLQSFYAAAFTR